MIYYLLFLSIFWISALLEYFGSKYAWIISISFFVCIAGFRLETGWDWMTYELYFYQLDGFLNKEGSPLIMEQGFNFLIYYVKALGFGFQHFLFFIALLTGLFTAGFFLKTTSRVAFCLAVMYSFLYLTLNMTMMRQALSCAIELASVLFLMQHKYFQSFVFWVVACLVHTSSLIFGGVFIFVVMNVSLSWGLLYYGLCLIFGVISYFFQFNFFRALVELLVVLDLGFVGNKLRFYITQNLSFSPSLGGLFYFFLNISFSVFHQLKCFSNDMVFKVESFFLMLICGCMGFF